MVSLKKSRSDLCVGHFWLIWAGVIDCPDFSLLQEYVTAVWKILFVVEILLVYVTTERATVACFSPFPWNLITNIMSKLCWLYYRENSTACTNNERHVHEHTAHFLPFSVGFMYLLWEPMVLKYKVKMTQTKKLETIFYLRVKQWAAGSSASLVRDLSFKDEGEKKERLLKSCRERWWNERNSKVKAAEIHLWSSVRLGDGDNSAFI